jgi:predicted nucleotidyltransferase component of viral defense system
MQLKALVRNLSQQSHVAAETLLRNFMLERFLERIAVSAYRHSFILKGGMLIAAMVGIDSRSTMDMDATIKGQALSSTAIAAIMAEILAAPVDDGMAFTLRSIEEIREEAEYPGFRVSIGAVLDRTEQTLKIDITTGDAITPKEMAYRFKLMFENRSISILAYNLETILAEKFETAIARGVTNTRMRDFYDMYILTTTQPFQPETFRAALQKTAGRRGTVDQMRAMADTIETIASSPVVQGHWRRYQMKYSYAADVTWAMAMEALKNLAAKALRADD